MTELVKRTKHLCYRNYLPKVSSLMDPAVVKVGKSFAHINHIPALPKSELPNDILGHPYIGHNGEDTVGEWTQGIYSLPIPNAKVKKLMRNDKFRGNYLEYGNARCTVRQCHFASLLVVNGQSIPADILIGYEGKTGTVTGKHLHTSIIIDGKYVDPRYYVTGEIPFPGETDPDYEGAVKSADGFYNWKNTDKWELSISVETYKISTPGGLALRVRKSPGTDKDQVKVLNNGTIIRVDKICTLPDGQIWARLENLPWNWVCLKRGAVYAKKVEPFPEKLEDGFYYVRSSFENVMSQEGAYKLLSNAKRQAKVRGLKVFAPNGEEVL